MNPIRDCISVPCDNASRCALRGYCDKAKLQMGRPPGFVAGVSIATPKQEVDPNGVDAHAKGSKLDAGKPLPWLMFSGFSRALAAVADVTTKGALKYTPNGWAEVKDGEQRYMEGFMRHALAVGRGEQIDDGPGGTGCLHKAQMIWNLLASLELELRRASDWNGK